MNTIPSISELSIRRFADGKNFTEGKKNFRNGLLHNFHKQGMMLKGDYSGPDGRLAMKLNTHDTSRQKDFRRNMYTDFLFDLEAETLDKDEFLQACREEGRIVDLVDQLLMQGRIGEATKEAELANNLDLFKIADIFVKRGYRANAKRLMQERANNKDNTQAKDVLIQIWLNNHP
jgi:hypothetical protein